MSSKYDIGSSYPKTVNTDGAEVLDLNLGDFRYFNEWMTNRATSSHVVLSHETNRLDLISYAEYGTVDLWWIIGMFNGVVKFSDLVAGSVLQIPSVAQIESYSQLIRTMKNGQSVALRQ